MIAYERRLYMLDQLQRLGVVSLKKIARDLGISEATVRRDFEKLEKAGKLLRVQGGAQLATDNSSGYNSAELTMRQKKTLNQAAKEKIAEKASTLVKDGDCIFLDGGTSIAPLIRLLANRQVKIVTHNHLNVHELIHPRAEFFLVGGIYLPYYGMCVGSFAENALAQFHFDHAFIGCTGVDIEQKITFTSEIATMNMKNIGMAQANQSHLLMDSSKIHVKAFCTFKALDAFDTVFCNPADSILKWPDNFRIVEIS